MRCCATAQFIARYRLCERASAAIFAPFIEAVTGMRMDEGSSGPRVLIYSHDTFGLGHLRRSRAIANAIVASDGRAEALILSGSPVLDRFAFAPGVRTVRLPPVVKFLDGGYGSRDAAVPLDRTVALRTDIIARTCAAFDPDMIVVDKEPGGFHGELQPTLEWAAARGIHLILGLRDVLDDTDRLIPEWERKGAILRRDLGLRAQPHPRAPGGPADGRRDRRPDRRPADLYGIPAPRFAGAAPRT